VFGHPGAEPCLGSLTGLAVGRGDLLRTGATGAAGGAAVAVGFGFGVGGLAVGVGLHVGLGWDVGVEFHASAAVALLINSTRSTDRVHTRANDFRAMRLLPPLDG
jgi:hypothetical protein